MNALQKETKNIVLYSLEKMAMFDIKTKRHVPLAKRLLIGEGST
jgi:hypothetical protein